LVLLIAIHPKLNLPSLDRWGDISFGIYIYAFPVQQTLAHTMSPISPFRMFILSTAITMCLAIISWKLVEQPALKLKGKFVLPKKGVRVEA
jgi:peptidoglycan/LPS O-acetylase OafA/YrhL